METYQLTRMLRTPSPKRDGEKRRIFMRQSTRMPILLLIVFLLLTGCKSTPSGTAAIDPSPTTVAETCPQQMQTCLTPHALRVAYGIESLVQKGFTGKGQTIIDLVSFGSPTLQQDV